MSLVILTQESMIFIVITVVWIQNSENMDKSAFIGLDAYSPEPMTKEEIDEMKEDLKD